MFPRGASPNISGLNQLAGFPVMTVFGSYGIKLYVHELVMGAVVVVVQPATSDRRRVGGDSVRLGGAGSIQGHGCLVALGDHTAEGPILSN